MKGKDLISIHDLTLEEIEEIFDLARRMKETPADFSSRMNLDFSQ